VVLRFCQESEVNKKRQKSHQQKTSFLCKFKHLKHLGVKQELQRRIDVWAEEHLQNKDLSYKEALEERLKLENQIEQILKLRQLEKR
jgi:hypothetical protein